MKVLLAGLLGAGKSTICNELTNGGAKVSDSAESCTKEMTEYVGDGLEVIDVPGLGDPKITTKKWLSMANTISGQKYDCMLFVINGTNRVDNSLLLLGIAIKHMAEFPANSVIVVFTHADHDGHKLTD